MVDLGRERSGGRRISSLVARFGSAGLIAGLLIIGCSRSDAFGVEYRESFLETCVHDEALNDLSPDSRESACGCVYDGLEQSVPFHVAVSFERPFSTDPGGRPELQSIVDGCSLQDYGELYRVNFMTGCTG